MCECLQVLENLEKEYAEQVKEYLRFWQEEGPKDFKKLYFVALDKRIAIACAIARIKERKEVQ